jgi:hypothetical protein
MKSEKFPFKLGEEPYLADETLDGSPAVYEVVERVDEGFDHLLRYPADSAAHERATIRMSDLLVALRPGDRLLLCRPDPEPGIRYGVPAKIQTADHLLRMLRADAARYVIQPRSVGLHSYLYPEYDLTVDGALLIRLEQQGYLRIEHQQDGRAFYYLTEAGKR